MLWLRVFFSAGIIGHVHILVPLVLLLLYEDCSNQCLADLSYESLRVITLSQLQHPQSHEHESTVMLSGQHRFTRCPDRAGSWAESVLTEASARITHLASDRPPTHYEINHSFFQLPNSTITRQSYFSSSLVQMNNTTPYRRVQPFIALNRREWTRIVHKPPSKH